MPRYLTAINANNRVTKSTSHPNNLRRSSSSPLSFVRRTKSAAVRHNSLTRICTADSGSEDDERTWFANDGQLVSTFNVTSAGDVQSVMQYATTSVFSDLPDRAGMNSVQIAETLNYQRNLPPLVSIPHVHAIISASSKVEKDVRDLLSEGKLVKLRVTGRGNNVTGLGELLILAKDYRILLQRSGMCPDLITAFWQALQQNPRASSIPARQILPHHASSLLKSGFLVSSSLLGSRNLSLSGSSLTGLPAISRAASGTSEAIGGEAAFERLGGVGSGQRSRSEPDISTQTGELVLSVPNIGAYLKLLDAGRSHVIELLRSFKHRQAPLYLLRERWDGAVDSDSRVSQAKQSRGEFSQILPAKTKKWKVLHGLNFDWALEECLGAGMIELFETHSVGLGVRSLT